MSPAALPITAEARTSRARVLSGSAVLLAGLGLVTAINFAYNIAMARYLGPVGFGQTTVVYTLLILISAVTLSFQILTAKLVAQQESSAEQHAVYDGLHSRAWLAGSVVCAGLLLLRSGVSDYLNLGDPLLVVLLAIGASFYVPLGARRGYVLGTCVFRSLAANLVLEGLIRLCGSLLMINLGFGVRGVIAANAAAVVVAYFALPPKTASTPNLTAGIPVAIGESLQAAIFFAGQVVINNCDIVLVKHFFPADEAGVYAAAAMVGRVVFAFSWAIVSSMFPIAAEAKSRKREDYGVLATTLLMVAGICLIFIVGLRLAPGSIWTHLFGQRFATVGGINFRYILVLYAGFAGLYGLSVVLIAYEMSRKIANTGLVQLAIGGIVIVGIYLFHSSLTEVIWVQVFMMMVLLACVAVPFWITWFTGEVGTKRIHLPGFIRLRRRVSEDEVIAEFLKNDLHAPEYEQYKAAVNGIVTSPNLLDDSQNRVRRALLDVRHGSLWRELPKDTQWFQAEMDVTDLHRIRVFPRAQWRKLALGDFEITNILQALRSDSTLGRTSEQFRNKIERLRNQMQSEPIPDAILLIGVSENGPFTVLDGNHRLVAALLADSNCLRRFRFYCGLSSRMVQCCWYRTNFVTLSRYGTNMIRHVAHDPDRRLVRLLQNSGSSGTRAVS